MQVTPDIAIDDEEIRWDFIRAGGPGGQNVNKVSSAARLRFDVTGSPSLDEEVKRRLARLAGSRMTSDGELVILARSRRTQAANRADALARLAELITRAARRPKRRVPTRPPAASRRRRIESKKRRGQTKRLRRPPEQ